MAALIFMRTSPVSVAMVISPPSTAVVSGIVVVVWRLLPSRVNVASCSMRKVM